MRAPNLSTGGSYLIAAGATAAAFFIRLALDPWLGGASPLLLFTLAVMAAAVSSGLFAGLMATVLSAAAGSYFLGRDGVPGWSGEVAQLVAFSLVGAGISYLCGRLHAARRRAEAERVASEVARARAEAEVAERRRVEAALQAQKELLQTTLTSAGDGMVATDAEGKVTLLNPVAEALTGWTQAEAESLLLTTVFRIVNEQTRAEVENPALRALSEGRIVGLANHTVLIARDGTERPIDDSAAPIRDAAGRTQGAVLVFRDISERKRHEAALVASEARFRTLAEAVPQIVWVTRADGYHEFYNARWYEFTGLTPEESIGFGWSVPLHPDDKARSEARWKQATDTGESYEIEYRFRSKDGAYRWFLARALPDRDASGAVTRWFGTCTDIDDAKRAEQKAAFLADASAHLSELLDSRSTMQKVAEAAVPAFADWIAVDLVADDGSLRRVATTHSVRDKETLARELAEKYPPRPDDPHGPAKVFRSGDPELLPDVDDSFTAALARDGDHLRLLRSLGFRSYMSVPLVTKGRTTGVMTFVTADSGRRYDASDLQVAEDLGRRVAVAVENVGLYEALKDAHRRKDEFLATLAHELRNPLAPIRMGLEVLRLGGDDQATVDEMLDTMEGQVRHMVRLIDDLLDVSRITRGKLDLRKTRLDLREVLKAAADAVRPLAVEAEHKLTVSLPAEPLVLDGDPARLSQIFSNLLNNACKYTPDGGTITLSAERQGSDVVVGVRDTGIGVPPEMLQSVFEMFVQVDRTLERSMSGLGIGLTLVRRLVQLHGGTVEARSEGQGKGSEFVVRLPLVMSAGPPTTTPGRPAITASPRTGRRILVADDNRDAAALVSKVLSILGHEVRVAHDGERAVAEAESFRPEVCLLDIGMPKLSGYDACRAIRAEPWGEKIFLVALTGWGQEEDRRRSKEAGFDRHLVKPVEPAALQELLASAQPLQG